MKYLIITITTLTLLASCSNSESTNNGKKSKENYTTLIDSLEGVRKGFFDNNQMPTRKLVLESVQAFEFFVADYPKDEKAAEYLFESAKRYEIDLQDYKNAIRLYQEVYDNYPDYGNHAMALFHIGNVYHSMNSTEQAKTIFNEFKTKYPDHDFADDAEGMIKIIDMGGEEEFLKKVLGQTQGDSTEY